MLRNYFTVAFRNLKRNATYTILNAAGLSIGIAACIVIFLVVSGELQYDKFHSKYANIYRVTKLTESGSGTEHSATVPYPFGNAFRNDFPDIPLSTNIHFHQQALLSYGSEKLNVENIVFADSMFFDVFDYGVMSGNPRKELAQPGKVFLTKSLSNRLGNPKTIKLDNLLELEVAGIVNDPPQNSHITYSLIVSLPSFSKEFLRLPIDQWDMTVAGYTYVVLPPGVSRENIEQRLSAFEKKYHSQTDGKTKTYLLQPLADIHFNKEYSTNVLDKPFMSFNNLIVLSMLGAFILLVACINFINLSTALAVKKSREIGVRKTLGANRAQLKRQYLAEAFIITLLSAILAIVGTEISVGFVSSFLEKQITFNLFGNITLLVFLAGLILITALLAGLYPALVLSRFNPVDVLKNKLSAQGSSGSYARKYLVVFQFLIAQLLIIGTLVVADQMDYFRSKPLGFTHDAVVNITLPDSKEQNRTALTAELASIPGVEEFSYSLGAPTARGDFETSFFLTERGNSSLMDLQVKPVDINYAKTYGLELVAGRWFLPGDEKLANHKLPDSEQRYHYVVNEALVSKLGFASNEEILGKYITLGLNDINAPVIGVVKNFHTGSLHKQIPPVVLMHFPYFYLDAGIRLNKHASAQTMASIEKAFEKVFPENIFDYKFLDQQLGSLYRQEEKALTMIRVFAFFSIVISCLGLLGLVSFLTQQKVKEVGIRKVFGASAWQIMLLFSRSFAGLVLIAFLIAAPIGWYAMTRWLEGFAYHAPISIGVFVIAVVATSVVTLLTVSFQSAKASLANPVKALRSE
ncbi:MAG TPA: ABC transporter permease [Cyclobacteriaceae bacterium]|nr:ABC transporter permease [Cyclobacteriaceae bacterium]